MEDGRDGNFPSAVAVLGFTAILGTFSGIGVEARLAYRQVVVDGPFNPTYGLSLKSFARHRAKLRFFLVRTGLNNWWGTGEWKVGRREE